MREIRGVSRGTSPFIEWNVFASGGMLVRKWVTTVLWIPEEHYASDGDGGDNSDDDNGDDFNGDDFICLQFFLVIPGKLNAISKKSDGYNLLYL